MSVPLPSRDESGSTIERGASAVGELLRAARRAGDREVADCVEAVAAKVAADLRRDALDLHEPVRELRALLARLQSSSGRNRSTEELTELCANALSTFYRVIQDEGSGARRVPEGGSADGHEPAGQAPERADFPTPAPPTSEGPERSAMRRGAALRRVGSSRHGEERRASIRRTLEVDIGLHSESNFYSGLSEDLSEGGLFVATYRVLSVETAVRVTFALPTGSPITADARVVWIRDRPVGDSPPGMGLRFDDLPPDAETAIRRFMKQRPPLLYDV